MLLSITIGWIPVREENCDVFFVRLEVFADFEPVPVRWVSGRGLERLWKVRKMTWEWALTQWQNLRWRQPEQTWHTPIFHVVTEL